MRRRWVRADESGAYLILYALLAVALFTMAAIVLDIAALRQDRRADRAAADLAVTAGAADLDPTDPATVATACDRAWTYFRINRPAGASEAVTAPDCTGTFPAGDACTAATGARTATGTVGTATITITNPVPDGDPLMDAEVEGGDRAQGAVPSSDGAPCQRLGIHITRTRPFAFGAIAGQGSGGTNVHSVARSTESVVSTTVPALVVLDRTGCGALTTLGQGGVLHVAGAGQAGIIDVDSDGTGCGSGSYVIDAGGGGGIVADSFGPSTGVVRSYAMAGPNPTSAYNPADIGAGRLSPPPSPLLKRDGRTIVDTRYNCTATCAPGSDHINQLVASLGGPGVPPGFTPWAGPCLASTPQVIPVGDWYVDCPTFEVASNVTFQGGRVVFTGAVTVDDGACLAVDDAACGDTAVAQDNTLYLRAGDITKAGTGQVAFNQTFVYLNGAMQFGPDFVGGASRLSWTAPLGGDFKDLLAWTESSAAMAFGGQATLVLQGILFAPNTSGFEVAGRPGGTGMVAQAQLIANRVFLSGTRNVTLTPLPGRSVGTTTRLVRLVR